MNLTFKKKNILKTGSKTKKIQRFKFCVPGPKMCSLALVTLIKFNRHKTGFSIACHLKKCLFKKMF